MIEALISQQNTSQIIFNLEHSKQFCTFIVYFPYFFLLELSCFSSANKLFFLNFVVKRLANTIRKKE